MEIILIGLGASGVSFVSQLSRLAMELGRKDIALNIISTNEYFAKGEAFGLSRNIHILNTPIDTMGLDALNTQSYLQWIKRHDNQAFDIYTKRLQYSSYIHDVYDALKTKYLNIQEYKSEAIDIDVKERICIHTCNGNKVYGDYLIYSPGTVNSNNFEQLIALERFHNNPHTFSDINKYSSVGVLGSSLTAVDVVRDLVDRGHQGKITMYSRKGFPPTCISLENQYVPLYFTLDNMLEEAYDTGHLSIMSLIKLLAQDLNNVHNEFFDARKQKNVGDFWRYLYKRSSNGDLPFQDMLVSTRFYAHKMWLLLGDQDKLLFNFNFSSLWASWRHPIPRSVIRELYYLHDDQQINVCKINGHPIPIDKGFQVHTDKGIKKEDYIIDGTGGSNNVNKTTDPFLRSLLKKDLAQSNPFGGIAVDPHTYQIINDKSSNMYAIGQIAKGSLFSTNAFWFNAKTAKKITEFLLLD